MTTAPLSNLTATWNSAGTTFSAIKMNVTDTASAAGSLLLDLQVGGASQFGVSKGGVVSVGSTIELGHASDTTLARGSAGVLTVEGNTVYTSNNLPGTAITWTAAQTFNSTVSLPAGFTIRKQDNAFDGGELVLEKATNSTLSGNIIVDMNNNSLRILENGGSFRGVLLDITGCGSQSALYHSGNLPGTAITWTANQTLSNVDLVLATGAGTKIGTATNQKLGFFNATPVVQPTAVDNATDAASVITQLNALLSRMRTLGLIAT